MSDGYYATLDDPVGQSPFQDEPSLILSIEFTLLSLHGKIAYHVLGTSAYFRT